MDACARPRTLMHAHMYARMHARTHTRMHALTHSVDVLLSLLLLPTGEIPSIQFLYSEFTPKLTRNRDRSNPDR